MDDGEYLDGTLTSPELALGQDIPNLLGANSIILKEGVYDMVQDEGTGYYSITIDASIQ